jgi:hypothetical protein
MQVFMIQGLLAPGLSGRARRWPGSWTSSASIVSDLSSASIWTDSAYSRGNWIVPDGHRPIPRNRHVPRDWLVDRMLFELFRSVGLS